MATPTALASAVSAPPTAGAFQDALGNVLTNGKLTFDLSQTAAISGGGELAPTRVIITLDANGKVAAGQSMYRNTDLTPSGTTYQMQAFNSGGNFVGSWGAQTIAGSAPIDLAILIPSTSSAGLVSLSAVVLQQPTVPQVINGQPLTMEGTLLGFSGAGSTTPDSGISRVGAAALAIGNGTQGNTSGTARMATSLVGDGAVGTPSNTFINETTTGTYRAGAQDWRVSVNSTDSFRVNSTGVLAPSGRPVGWGSAGVTATDTGLSRTAAGTVAIGNGTQGDTSGLLKVATIQNTSLVSATSGNTVTLAFAPIFDSGALTGNSGNQIFFTSTLLANTVSVGKGFKLRSAWSHSTGTATITYLCQLNGVNVVPSQALVSSAPANTYLELIVLAKDSTHGNSMGWYGTVNAVSTVSTTGIAGLAWGSNQTLLMTFNVANTDQITPVLFVAEIIQ